MSEKETRRSSGRENRFSVRLTKLIAAGVLATSMVPAAALADEAETSLGEGSLAAGAYDVAQGTGAAGANAGVLAGADADAAGADGATASSADVAASADAAGEQVEGEGAGGAAASQVDFARKSATATVQALAFDIASDPAAQAENAKEAYELNDGVNIAREGLTDRTFNIDEGKVLMIEGTDTDPIVFKNCTFNLSGSTMKISGNQQGISYNSGETITKLFVGKNVRFDNCAFVSNGGQRLTTAGYDACIYFFGGDIELNGCTLTGTNYQGQFMGLYGRTGSVTFNDSAISTVGNTGGWSYAMYGTSVLNLNRSTMTATGMKRAEGGGNVNAFYSGDLSTNYDAINIKDSTIDFSDNYGGGFAINRVNIHVDNSTIKVNDNAGNGANSGVWYVRDSTIQMNGNKTHGWSHIADHCVNTTVEILHNGYAGYYITADSDMQDCTVDIRCNGERLLSYSAGDMWLNTHTLELSDCDYVWLGAVGRKGAVKASNCPYVVAYDLVENKTKGNTESVLDGVTLAEQDEHVLFLNPSKDFDYARGDTEGRSGNSNDDDLFEDVGIATAINKDTAKIGKLTTAQLSHHVYDWNSGSVLVETDASGNEVRYVATEDAYGVMRYECVDTCAEHVGWIETHPDSFSCTGTYVYAPLVGVTFDANLGGQTAGDVTNMPKDQVEIAYEGSAVEPDVAPQRASEKEGWKWEFTGWYLDPECMKAYDFDTQLTDNWTVLYAGWKMVEDSPDEPLVPSDPEPSDSEEAIKPTPLAQTGDELGLSAAAAAVAAGAASVVAVAAARSRKRNMR